MITAPAALKKAAIVIGFLAAFFVFVIPAPAQDRSELARTEAAEAAAQTVAMAEDILKNYFKEFKSLTDDDIEAIKQALQENKANAFYKTFEPDAKANYYIIQALLAHYQGDSKLAMQQAGFAMKSAPNNGQASDTAITLALIWGEYELAKTALETRQAGSAAQREKTDAPVLPELSPTGQPIDPNTGQPYKIPDPNELKAAKKKAEEAQPEKEEPKSAFAKKYGAAPQGEVKTPEQLQREQMMQMQGMPPGAMPGMPGGPGMPPGAMPPGGPGMGPGMMMGPMAPAPPDMMAPGVGVPGRPNQPGAARGAQQDNKIQFTPSVLELPVEYMPYEALGATIDELTVPTLNGSYFQYQKNQGRLLAVLFWMLPEDGQAILSDSQPRTSYNQPQMFMDPRTGMMMPAPQGTPETGENIWDLPVETGLAETFDQFRKLYLIGRQTGVAEFLAVNQDGITLRNKVIAASIEHPWPWAVCIADEALQQDTWPVKKKYSPVVMLVNPQGTVCYMGPMGGFLPRLILKREMDKAKSALLGSTKTPAGGLLNMAGKLFGGKSEPAAPAPTAAAPETAASPAAAAATAAPKAKESDMQAANMLRGAQAMKRTNPRRACELCDDVIERFPDSLEADEARLMIESILQSNSRLRDERQAAGKYTGQ